MSADIDLAPALVGQDHGSEVANDIGRRLVLYHQRGYGPSQFSALPQMGSGSDRIQTALAFAKENLKDALSVAVLAEVAQLSPRQFTRVFREETGVPPAKAVERLRVEAARLMFETTPNSLKLIARECGFGDPERMRRSFRRAFGHPPQTFLRSARMSGIDVI